MRPEYVHEMFARAVDRYAERPALLSAEGNTTYGDLDRRSSRLAGALRDSGAERGAIVAILSDETLDTAAAVLACLKAGCAFMPLAPETPAPRLAAMFAAVPPDRFIVGAAHIERILAASAERGAAEPRMLAAALAADAGLDAAPLPPVSWAPDDLAYVFFTSGSTGSPKGIAGRLKAIDHFVRWEIEALGVEAGFRVSQLVSPGFDAVLRDLFVPLCAGGAVCIPPDRSTVLDAGRLTDWIDAAGVELIHCVPSLFRAMLNEPLESEMFAALRYVLLAGEHLLPADVGRWMDVFGDRVKLVNLYGPSETTMTKFVYFVQQGDRGRASIPIGKPMPGAAAAIVDARGKGCPPGTVGEIYIRTPYRSLGYLNQPELTRQAFIPNPFNDDPNDIVYRTGDLGRALDDGSFELLGRRDSQVKIRGVRIELGEVESALREHRAVKDVAVIDREDRPGFKMLCAYVVVGEGGDPEALREFVARRLPETMVPSAFVTMEKLPKTLTGKVDRKALPPPTAGPDRQREYVAPRNQTEELLGGIWSGLLGLETVGVTDNFFELGGHSLLATRLLSRVRESFKVELPLQTLFSAPTLERLALRVESAMRSGAGVDGPPLVPAPRDRRLRLSFAQQRLWFLDQLEPGDSTYNLPMVLRLAGRLEVDVLRRALAEIVRRHESLRTTFDAGDDEPVQRIHPPSDATRLPVLDLGGLAATAGEREAERLGREEARRPFDLARGPLLRVHLLRLGGRLHHALATLHHIVSDAWSTGVLTREVGLLYRAYAEGRPSPLPELAIQYADFAEWQRGRLAGELLAKEIAYWRDALAGAPPVLELPTDRPRPAMRSSRGSARAAVLPRALASSLAKLGRSRGATRFMTLLAGFHVLVARLARVDDVSIGTPIAGRNRIETEGLIGFFVNTLVLRAQLGDEPTFLALLDRVRRSALAAQAHQELPFEKLVEELAPERSLSHSPLFQVMFVLQNAPRAELELPGLTLDALAQEGGAAKFDLTLTLVEGDEELHATAEYATDLFDGASIVRLLEHYGTLLDGVAAGPDRAVSDLPLLSSGELGQLLREWNDSGTVTTEQALHELVEAQTERTPEAIAVLADSGWLTYRDLEVSATRLARHLQALGVAPETRVGIFAERSLEMVVGLLAVLKAGGAYVPLDPDYPRERLAFMLDDSRVPVLLTQQRLAAALPEHDAQVVYLDAAWAESSGDDERRPVVAAGRVHPDHAAYVIYTSGSTGRPKGAINTHRAIVNRLLWMQDAYRLDATDRVLQKTPFSFDVSVWEFFLPLLSGARLVIARPGGHQDPAYLRRTIVDRGITTVHFVPSMLHAFLAEDDVDRCVSLVRVIASGEALPWDLEQRFFARLPAVELHNLYGPTEASVDVTAWACGADEGTRSIVPIGRPIANAQIYLFDRRLRPVPLGATGELYIGGMPLARGYLGRPKLTAEKFVPDPFGECPGARLYRTGDLARHRQDGAIEYLGRTDHQVKLRGFRIELGEIESALVDHPSVGEAVLVLREDSPGDRRVVAYVVGRDGGTPSTVELGGFLRGRLPEHMAPSAIVALDRLPLTPNGKLDRRALPAPSRQLEAATFEAPRTEIETVLAAIWSEVLRVEEVGAHDDFFALGGHSLLATQVMSRVRRILRLELPLRVLFSAPTLSGLAAAVERELRSAGALEAPPILPVPRDGALPLSFAQQRLWFLDRLEPGNPAYNSFVAFRISGALRPEILERSLGALVERHESLRSTFEDADGIPAQRVMPPPAHSLPQIALMVLLPAAREIEVKRLAGSFATRPFDLQRGPLLRACLVGTGEAEHVAFLCLHHIVADGWSLGILMREVTALYQAFAAGRPSDLPPLPVQYPDYADWQRHWLRGEVLEGFIAYWRDQLAGAPPLLALPLDRPRPGVQSYAGAAQAFALSPELSRALRDFGRRAGATPFMTMLAGFEVLVQRYSGQSDLSIGTAIANRNRFETEGLIGFLVNTLVLRTRLADDPTCGALLERVRDVALDAYAHQDMPFEKLVEELQPQRNLAHAPLFQIGFDFQNWSLESFALAGLELRRMRFDSVASKFDLTVTTNEAGGSLLGGIEYNTDLFDAPTIARLMGHFERLLAGMVASPGRRISELALLGEGERHQLLVAWNDTVADLPGGDGCLHELVAAQAAKSPDTVAVVFEEECLTFGELVRRAGCLAGRLRGLGVGPEVRVGLAAERSPSMLVGLLGILGADGAYVPLDPDQPRERLARVLEDSGATMVVSPDPLANRWPASVARVSP
ncbi:MAG TPA: amino acid adenylation domain-containing protein, partial [Thermoanaerobaculia bacterium]|nr:amino acid adenylation domain-containing protein [Thermoanaerobaculia bacterium]